MLTENQNQNNGAEQNVAAQNQNSNGADAAGAQANQTNDPFLVQLNVKVTKDCPEKQGIIERVLESLTSHPKLVMIENVTFAPNGRILFCRADLLQLRFGAWRKPASGKAL